MAVADQVKKIIVEQLGVDEDEVAASLGALWLVQVSLKVSRLSTG